MCKLLLDVSFPSEIKQTLRGVTDEERKCVHICKCRNCESELPCKLRRVCRRSEMKYITSEFMLVVFRAETFNIELSYVAGRLFIFFQCIHFSVESKPEMKTQWIYLTGRHKGIAKGTLLVEKLALN